MVGTGFRVPAPCDSRMHHNQHERIQGYVPLGWSGLGPVIQDHSDYARSNETMNPCPEWIHRFIWSTMIRVISDYWSWSGSSQRNAPQVLASLPLSTSPLPKKRPTLPAAWKVSSDLSWDANSHKTKFTAIFWMVVSWLSLLACF